MGDLTKNFSRYEFACNCGCGFDNINPTLINMLQTIRSYIGEPFDISSGCRCKYWNKHEKGKRNSQHLLGNAADIHCRIGAGKLYTIIKKLYISGAIPVLGYAQLYVALDFVHLDVRPNKSYTVRRWA